jgi:hypothetical protein
MSDSPFIYGTTVHNRSFTNRETECEKLSANLLNGINTIIVSSKRCGKSSLVEKVIQDINKKDNTRKTVCINMFSLRNEEEFLEVFAREVIKTSSATWQDWLGSGRIFFKRLMPQLTVGADPFNDFKVSFDWNQLKKHSEEVLNLPETIAQKKNIKIIICIDEFQYLASFPDYERFEKSMRAAWQRQKMVTYCLYGSKGYVMSDIFNNQFKPFYRFGQIMSLPKIETGKWVKFICESFSESGKNIAEKEALTLIELAKNNSWYVQQLAHYTWNHTNTKSKVSQLQIEIALKEIIQANFLLYQKEIETLSATQLFLLKAVAKGETQFTSIFVMNAYHLGTPNNVRKNKTLLINNDLIEEEKNMFKFCDPIFELWFRKQFFNEPYKV